MIILGIETSCDETAAALVEANGDNLSVLANTVSSQVKIHAKWGGVVPNLASREHVKNIIPVLDAAFRKADLSPKKVDLIAVTQGPGLIPALLIGTSAAKTLSYLWSKPLLGIHHIEGHIFANFISNKIDKDKNKIKFPILCLVVSGGHTQLVLMKKKLDYEIVGQTLDDAAGEAFDKVARILGLGYPGGPAIAASAAKKSKKLRTADHELALPRPMINKSNFDFSFSGLKTAVLYAARKLQLTAYNKQLLAKEFQQAVIDVLVHKTLKAAQKYNPQTIMLAGGVSANTELRKQLGTAIAKNIPCTKYQIPDINYSIDNAAMIAAAGYFRWQKMTARQQEKALANWIDIEADANLELS